MFHAEDLNHSAGTAVLLWPVSAPAGQLVFGRQLVLDSVPTPHLPNENIMTTSNLSLSSRTYMFGGIRLSSLLFLLYARTDSAEQLVRYLKHVSGELRPWALLLKLRGSLP